MSPALNSLIQRFQSASETNLWLLSGLVLAFMPHLIHLPVMLILFSTLLLAWRLGYELNFFRLPSRTIRMLLTLSALIITFAAFHTFFGRQAGVVLAARPVLDYW
jgi:hypothetical protein